MEGERITVERLSVSSQSFRPHTHNEFVLSLNGASVIHERVKLDRQRFAVGAGSVTTYNPHQIQSSVTETINDVPWDCISVYAPEAAVALLTGHGDIEFVEPIVDGPHVARGLRYAAHRSGDEAEEWAMWSLAEALASNSSSPRRSERASSLIEAAKRHLTHGLDRPSSLDDLSRQLGTARDTLVWAFVRATGVPPYAWQLQLRLSLDPPMSLG